MSHAPCTFGSPRSALTPLPGLPTLPSKSCRMVNARIPFCIKLITPGLRAVLVLLRVEPAEESILEVESRVAQKEGVGMGCDVVFVVQLVHKDVVNYGVEKRSVGTGTNARVHVGRR